MEIGTIIRLKVECLNNAINIKGVVFDKYQDFDFPDKQGYLLFLKMEILMDFQLMNKKVF